AYDAIFEFVDASVKRHQGDLTKSTAPNLYRRLLERIKNDTDTIRKEKVITSFQKFMNNRDAADFTVKQAILEGNLDYIAELSTKIEYENNEKIFFPISSYVYKAKTNEEKNLVLQHLATILSIFDPSKTNLSKLESLGKAANSPFGFVDDSCQEGAFL